jgi:integrase
MDPPHEAALPHREQVIDNDDEHVKALSRDQLAAFLEIVHPDHRLMFRLLAATGLRVSELLALQWQHLELDGSTPVVRVRRALVYGRIHPPKTRHAHRDVPLPHDVVMGLKAHRKDLGVARP